MEESIVHRNISVGIASDHAGFKLKESVKTHLANLGYSIMDYGTISEDSTDYTSFAHIVGRNMELKTHKFSILICGSGQGMSMTVNKYNGVRGALCWNEDIAILSKKHNNANVLCLPSRFISDLESKFIVTRFLETEFEGGRHEERVDNIQRKQLMGDAKLSTRLYDQS